MNATFSIIVPLFNEAENINPLIQAIIKVVGTNPGFLEIVLVDDGSRDATAAKAANLAAQDKRICLVRHECNKGLGAAIRTGLNAASGDFVLYTDADLPFDFNLIPQLFSLAEENCIVSGYRLNRGEGGRRFVLTKVYNFLIWLFFGLYMRDVNFACKIFPKRFLKRVKFNSSGSFIDVEILLEARRLGLNIIEHPLVYYPRTRGLSTLSRPSVIVFILKEMFAYSAKLFTDKITLLRFIKVSPLAKLAIYSTTALISAILLFERAYLFQDATRLLSALGTGIVSLLLGWRAGLMAAIVVTITAESSLLWQNQAFFSPAFFPFLIYAWLSVVFSQLVYRSWMFVQKSIKLNTSE